MSTVEVRALTAPQLSLRQEPLASFERSFVYPLGHDHFHLDHGRDYLAFFRALGEPFPYVAQSPQGIVGVLIAVRKSTAHGAVWYLCDLKVSPVAAERGLGQRLLATWARERLEPAAAVFGVSMNAADGSNRMARVARRCPAAGVVQTTDLVLFSLTYEAWQHVAPRLERELGTMQFFDPHGTKDIVLASTGQPLPLLHAQHGPLARRDVGPARPLHTHMLCLPAADALVVSLADLGVRPAATATVLHRALPWFDWRHLLTSDI